MERLMTTPVKLVIDRTLIIKWTIVQAGVFLGIGSGRSDFQVPFVDWRVFLRRMRDPPPPFFLGVVFLVPFRGRSLGFV